VTTRGMKEPEMELIASLIDRTLRDRENEDSLKDISEQVKALTSRFPFYNA